MNCIVQFFLQERQWFCSLIAWFSFLCVNVSKLKLSVLNVAFGGYCYGSVLEYQWACIMKCADWKKKKKTQYQAWITS